MHLRRWLALWCLFVTLRLVSPVPERNVGPHPDSLLERTVLSYVLQHASVSPATYTPGVKYVVVSWAGGWGNRLPPLITAFALALFSNRRLVLHAHDMNPNDYLQFSLDVYAPVLSSYTSQPHLNLYMLTGGDITTMLTTNFSDTSITELPVWLLRDIDYKLPLLQVNPSTRAFFASLFPNWEVFRNLAPWLFKPVPRLANEINSFAFRNFRGAFVLGVQMRTLRIKTSPSIFFQLARSAAESLAPPGARIVYFLLSDDATYYEQGATFLGNNSVCWTDNKVGSGETAGDSRNPGTFNTGIIDMFLLSHTNMAVITHGSSFGYTGSAYAGVKTMYVMGHQGGRVSMQSWYWISLTSEPCFFDINKLFALSRPDISELMMEHAHWAHHVQCHPPVP